MLLSSRFPKWAVVAISILALLATLFFGPASNASASINYGEEVSEVAKRYVGTHIKRAEQHQKVLMQVDLHNMSIKKQQQR